MGREEEGEERTPAPPAGGGGERPLGDASADFKMSNMNIVPKVIYLNVDGKVGGGETKPAETGRASPNC